jgi:hypothetical protein
LDRGSKMTVRRPERATGLAARRPDGQLRHGLLRLKNPQRKGSRCRQRHGPTRATLGDTASGHHSTASTVAARLPGAIGARSTLWRQKPRCRSRRSSLAIAWWHFCACPVTASRSPGATLGRCCATAGTKAVVSCIESRCAHIVPRQSPAPPATDARVTTGAPKLLVAGSLRNAGCPRALFRRIDLLRAEHCFLL